jgi:hypothetical protein
MMEYRILGPLEAVESGSEIDLGTSKGRPLALTAVDGRGQVTLT